jgi:hypothetical protein
MEWLGFGCVGAALGVWLWADWKGLRNTSWGLRALADILAVLFLVAAAGLLIGSMLPPESSR